MRKASGLLVGIIVLLALLGSARPGEAIDTCTVTGTYYLSGFAQGNTEVYGLLTFTPNGTCTGGTFTGSITIKPFGGAFSNFAPTGTYTVSGDTTSTVHITAPGLVDLTALVSQIANNVANAIHAVGDVAGSTVVGLVMTQTTLTGAIGPTGPGGIPASRARPARRG